ncbi:hypothetical protein [Pseudoalteromonas sp. TB51]|uniref:hypothetical protein n=1 Tax=Pseudoalteromonas sp. TB51 TaxID=1055803 RepID=UPI00041F650B|nr:hypothetical protein [Pseudoalteromonas sp. TB51]
MKIIISHNNHAQLKELASKIDTRIPENKVTAIVSKKEQTIVFIVGKRPLFNLHNFKLSEQSTSLKDKKYAIDASFIKQLPDYFTSKVDIELNIRTDPKKNLYMELQHINTKHNAVALRRCTCSAADPEHLEYLKDNKKMKPSKVSKALITKVVEEATKSLPFELLEFRKDCIRIQRDGEVRDKPLSDALKLATPLTITEAITKQLADLCETTNSSDIEINQAGDVLTFKTEECTVTHSLAGIEEFRVKTPTKTKTLLQFELDFYTFKEELRHCIKAYKIIKKENRALLYLNKEQAAVAFFTDPYEFVLPIEVSEVNAENTETASVYHFSPTDLINIKIKDLVGAKTAQFDILQEASGELKLGVYYAKDDILPSHTIPIERDDSQYKKVASLLASLNKNDKNKGVSEPEERIEKNDFFNSDFDDEY